MLRGWVKTLIELHCKIYATMTIFKDRTCIIHAYYVGILYVYCTMLSK